MPAFNSEGPQNHQRFYDNILLLQKEALVHLTERDVVWILCLSQVKPGTGAEPMTRISLFWTTPFLHINSLNALDEGSRELKDKNTSFSFFNGKVGCLIQVYVYVYIQNIILILLVIFTI